MTTNIPQVLSECLPNGLTPFLSQVAGHTFKTENKEIGILKADGYILKPDEKLHRSEREISFYESLNNTTCEELLFLKQVVPEYKGVYKIKIDDKEINFIKLSDLTYGMNNPCIMDIKIGQRTWDPLATPQKIEAEKKKYLGTRNTVGFCIPGFHIYDVEMRKTQRFGRDYGKQLNEKTSKDSLRMFMSLSNIGLYKPLVEYFLDILRSIKKWAHMQKQYKIYSSSILLVYDPWKLTEHSKNNSNCDNTSNGNSSTTLCNIPSDNGELNRKSKMNGDSNSIHLYNELEKSYSEQNNLKKDAIEIHSNNPKTINHISNGAMEKNSNAWARLKMIDFAHAFRTEDGTLDDNYIFGIDNLVRIFEELLNE